MWTRDGRHQFSAVQLRVIGMKQVTVVLLLAALIGLMVFASAEGRLLNEENLRELQSRRLTRREIQTCHDPDCGK